MKNADKQVRLFMASQPPPGSLHAILKTFLLTKHRKGLSVHTVNRYYYSIHPIAEAHEGGSVSDITAAWLKGYIDGCWLRYAPESVRSIITDVRHFFRWCKKKGHHKKNIAKRIKPAKKRPRRHRRTKAAPEAGIIAVMRHLAGQLIERGLIYRDIFRRLALGDGEWDYPDILCLRDLFILTFLYETGARGGELAALGSQAMCAAVDKPASVYMVTVIGKTDDSDYYFTSATADLWHIWQQVRPQEQLDRAVVGWQSRTRCRAISTDGISHMLVRRCEAAGVRPFRAHSLRHAKTKRSVVLVGIETTRQLLDHANLETTRDYNILGETELGKAALATGLQEDFFQPDHS